MNDEQYRQVKDILDSHENRLKKIEELLTGTESLPVIVENKLENIANGLEVSIEDLQKIVDLENEDFTIIVQIPGERQEEKQINGTLLLLAISKYGYNRDSIKTSTLKQKIEWLGISQNNLSRSMRKIQGQVIPRGKPRTNEFEYKITLTGLERAKQIIQVLI